MIGVVMGALAPEVEAIGAQGNEEEEGSSSTPGKEDKEGVNVNIKDQLVNLPSQQIEVQQEEQEGQAPIEVEESASERDYEEEAILVIEDEV